MKRKALVVFIACLIVFLEPVATAAAVLNLAEEALGSNPPSLWNKALDVFQKNSDWFPGKVSVLSEILDRKGRPDSVTRLFFNILVDDKGNARTELLQAFKDGKDVSAEMKKKMESNEAQDEKNAKKKDAYTISLADSPFNPDKQRLVTVQATGEKQLLFEKTCRRFDFSFQTEVVQKSKKQKLTWVGKAWLDENSGIPVKLEFSFAPLPKHVNNLWTIYLYEANAAGDWLLKEIKVQGQGGFLFIKKGFRSTTSFSDYRRQPQKGDDK